MTLETLALPSILEEHAEVIRLRCCHLLNHDSEFHDVKLTDESLVSALAITIQFPQTPSDGPQAEWRTAVADFARRQSSIGVTARALRYLSAAAHEHIDALPEEQRLESASRLQWATFFGLEIAARHAAEEIARLAFHSEVTGLRNRRALEQDLARISSPHSGLQIAYIDMDGLKAINDTEGHDAGNNALTSLASTLAAELEDGAVAYHLSGDEFAVTAKGMNGEQVDAMIVRALHKADSKFSYGIAELEPSDCEWQRVLADADRRMNSQKERRRQAGNRGIRE